MEQLFDIKDIQDKFNKVVAYSQNISGEINTDALFKDWLQNKKCYINAWGGKLIKELGEQSFHLSEEQRIKAVSNVIDQIEYIYRESGIGYPDFRFDDLVNFILENQDNFFENIVNNDWGTSDFTIPKGMKILRAFKFFCKDKNLLNDIQSVASMAIQNDKVTGILCMSVHPLDYLSLSENVHNWRSCHALDGEYRGGNLSYMADKCTVICYLKSSHKAELPRFPKDIKWNSKKWRMLLFFDDLHSAMMAGRQYPFFENSLLMPIKHEVENMFNTKFSGWFDQYHTFDKITAFLDEENETNEYEINYGKKYIPIGGRLLSFKKFVQNGEGTLQFNDLLESSSYTEPYYSFKLARTWIGNYIKSSTHTNIIPKIKVGKKVACLECGKENITMSESFLCKHCMIKENQISDSEEFGTCHWCGEPFLWDEGGYIYDQWGINQATCPDCLASAIRCKGCEELFHESAVNSKGLCINCAESEENSNIGNRDIRSITFDLVHNF